MSPEDIEITTDRTRINVDLVHAFLSSSYWAQGRSRAVIERSFENSLCFSVFQRGQQVAFGRAITDHAVFAYIADVFVIPECRGAGISGFSDRMRNTTKLTRRPCNENHIDRHSK